MAIKCIPLSNAQAGMILAKAVLDEKGRVLCKAETSLSEKLIYRFENMGVNLLYIQSDEEFTLEKYHALEQEIRFRFKHVTQGNMMFLLKTIILERLEARKPEK